ncbi:MAG: hypothetical protein C4K47_07505 [Candidatus Thorarchaeota archaeon]|nr:MAG: hypothetical protein C4K47_07505 [Candidatus Thorarchaeota archaeon]
MTGTNKLKLPTRESYSVGSLIEDLKVVEPTPSSLYKIGSEVVYFEWTCCKDNLGEGSSVTSGLSQLLEFMQGGYEQRLVKGELWRATDTPKTAIGQFAKTLPGELMDYVLGRPVDYIQNVLQSAYEQQLHDMKDYERLEEGVRREIDASPNDSDLYNKLRLLLWILGRYKESSQAFRVAKKLGWNPETSKLVAL